MYMGRPRKFVNTSVYPDNAIETLTRILYQDMVDEIAIENSETYPQTITTDKEISDTKTQKINPHI